VVVLTYSQTTGEMRTAVDVLLGTGYAGHGAGVNNPTMQSIHNTGPLPQGIYAIAPPVNTATHGPYVMWLTPDPANEMFGRSGFGIHADEIANPGKRLASTGCIVMSNQARLAIWETADRQLRVTA
jgi:Protein of unknown function (DUF2778)